MNEDQAATDAPDDYGRGYADALSDQRYARQRLAERHREARRGMYASAVKTGALYGAAYALGLLLGDLIAAARTAGGDPR